MRSRIALIMWVLAAALAVYLAWTWLLPGPEKIIRKRLAEMRELVSFSSNEGPLAKLANSEKLLGYFTPDIEIRINIPGRQDLSLSGREDLRQAILGARSQVDSIHMEFHDIRVMVDATKTSATTLVTVRADGATGGEPFVERMRIYFTKTDGKWLVSAANRAPVVR